MHDAAADARSHLLLATIEVRLVRLGSLTGIVQRLRSCRTRPDDTDDDGDFSREQLSTEHAAGSN
jgi:hypothetical protein